jgi:hypothetical protein
MLWLLCGWLISTLLHCKDDGMVYEQQITQKQLSVAAGPCAMLPTTHLSKGRRQTNPYSSHKKVSEHQQQLRILFLLLQLLSTFPSCSSLFGFHF